MRKQYVAYIVLAVVLLLGSTLFVSGAIQQLAGLAGAQTATKWVNTKDMSVGDGITSGALAIAPYLFDGSVGNRARGTIANGLAVDVTRAPGSNQTPADNFTNPTTFQGTWSLIGFLDGTTWDQWRGNVSPTQAGTLLNSVTNSAANTLLTITLTGAAGQRVHLYKISRVSCFPNGTSEINILDNVTTIWTSHNPGVPTIPLSLEEAWVPGLTASTGNNMVINIPACGTGNSSTITVQADRY